MTGFKISLAFTEGDWTIGLPKAFADCLASGITGVAAVSLASGFAGGLADNCFANGFEGSFAGDPTATFLTANIPFAMGLPAFLTMDLLAGFETALAIALAEAADDFSADLIAALTSALIAALLPRSFLPEDLFALAGFAGFAADFAFTACLL